METNEEWLKRMRERYEKANREGFIWLNK